MPTVNLTGFLIQLRRKRAAKSKLAGIKTMPKSPSKKDAKGGEKTANKKKNLEEGKFRFEVLKNRD